MIKVWFSSGVFENSFQVLSAYDEAFSLFDKCDTSALTRARGRGALARDGSLKTCLSKGRKVQHKLNGDAFL